MLITNNFIKNNSTTFKGKFSLIDAKCDISGVRYFNKKVVVTKDYFYHPSAVYLLPKLFHPPFHYPYTYAG